MEEKSNMTAERSLEIITEQIERSRRIITSNLSPTRISLSSESYLAEHDLLMIRDEALDVMADFV